MSAVLPHEKPRKFLPGQHPAWPSPISTTGPVAWVRTNLFSSPSNIVISLIALFILWRIIPPLLDWMIFDAVVDAGSRSECRWTLRGNDEPRCFVSNLGSLFGSVYHIVSL